MDQNERNLSLIQTESPNKTKNNTKKQKSVKLLLNTLISHSSKHSGNYS